MLRREYPRLISYRWLRECLIMILDDSNVPSYPQTGPLPFPRKVCVKSGRKSGNFGLRLHANPDGEGRFEA